MSDHGTTEKRLIAKAPPGGASDSARAAGDTPSARLRPVDDQPTVISKQPLSDVAASFRTVHPADLGPLLLGERLGHFELQEFVGGGGMGAVFRALDTMLNRIVAVKVLSQDQAGDEDSLRRFKNEAQSAARLDHENISRVFYVGEDRGLHYIVFEFIEGTNVRDLVDTSGPLSIADAVSYTLQIADALDHASQRDVVHRDIKPSNVIITPQGKAKLVDMGLARLHQVAPADDDLTASGVTLGTFDYISPEQARDPRSADVRSDLYSLGCTLYFMVTGRPPFPEGTVLQKLLKHQGDEPTNPRDLRPDLPSEVGIVLRRLMAKSPSARYQSPAALAADLAALAEAMGIEPHGASSSARAARVAAAAPRWRHHAPWAVPLAALLVLVLVLHFAGSSPDIEPSFVTAPGKSPTTASPGSPNSGPRETAKNNPSRDPQSAGTPKDDVASLPPEVAAWLRPAVERAADVWIRNPSATSSTASNGTPTAPAVVRKNVLIVAGPDDDPATFPSLNAAIAKAKNNDVIELRYSGRLEERPLVLSNQHITLRAADGFQPVIAFRPTTNLRDQPRSMITLVGGELSLCNVAIELDLPHDAVAERWALVETQQAESLRLENCWLTIRNGADNGTAFHGDVAFFDVRGGPGSDVTMLSAPQRWPVLTLELKNCVARGEADFLRSNELQPLRVQWENGLLATSERFFTADGGERAPRSAAGVVLQLRHVTALTREGLLRMTGSNDAPYQSSVSVSLEDSILVGDPRAVLVDQAGPERGQELQEHLVWKGQRNIYDEYEVFWTARGNDDEEPPSQYSFDDWCDYWGDQEELPGWSELLWMQPLDAKRPSHAAVPADFAINPVEENPAWGAAEDGGNAGVLVDSLPAAPVTAPAPARANKTSGPD